MSTSPGLCASDFSHLVSTKFDQNPTIVCKDKNIEGLTNQLINDTLWLYVGPPNREYYHIISFQTYIYTCTYNATPCVYFSSCGYCRHQFLFSLLASFGFHRLTAAYACLPKCFFLV